MHFYKFPQDSVKPSTAFVNLIVPYDITADENIVMSNMSIAMIVDISWRGGGGGRTLCRYQEHVTFKSCLCNNITALLRPRHILHNKSTVPSASHRLCRAFPIKLNALNLRSRSQAQSPFSMHAKSRWKLVGNQLLYAISVFASLGVFLFGYDQGVMSGIITGPHFVSFFENPNAMEVGSIVAVLEIGAFITSIAAGRIGDIMGRKWTLLGGAVIFTVGGLIQTFTIGVWSMILGRLISGFGVGLLSTIVPIYQSEISPPNHRGALACAEFTGNIIGYSFSVWTDYFCSFIDSNLSWRLPLFIQCVIGAILAGGSFFIPESPRWLIDNDRNQEGLQVLADLHGGDLDNSAAQAEYKEIRAKVILERESGAGRSYKTMWNKYRRRVVLAMSSQAFAQLNGINVISYYAPRVFEEAGWLGRQAILMTGINSLIYVLSTLPPWYLVDRWGRRPILLSGAVVMAFALAATGYFIYLVEPWTPNAVVASVIVFNAAFGYSWGPLPWLYPPEIMPLTFRAKGVSLSTATNWAFNWVVGQMTPYLQDLIEWRLYFMHSFLCVCSFILVYFTYPETKGVPLEEMDIVFGEGEESKNVRYSSSGGLGHWFKRIFTKKSSGSTDNRTHILTERESYAPLRGDHDHDHDESDEVQDLEEQAGEDYEMIERNPARER